MRGMRLKGGVAAGLIALALLAAVIAGCGVQVPRQQSRWAALLADIRAFERRVGFGETDNFTDVSGTEGQSAICGRASRLGLPYSYEDPAIQWKESVTEQECRAGSEESDVYYATIEAWGEVGTPLTPSILDGKLDRFFYLVIHEDCHDQFNLPYGVEEALCDMLSHKIMVAFSLEKYGAASREHKAVAAYALRQEKLAHATKAAYEGLEKIYARHARKEIPAEELLRERAAFYQAAEKRLQWRNGVLNNVALANDMTYSRHYPRLEAVHEALGRDLARTVAFFRRVDEIKPTRDAVRKRRRIEDEEGVEMVRAYEEEVMRAIDGVMVENVGK